MIYLIILALTTLLVLGLVYFPKKSHISKSTFVKTLSVLLFFTYLVRLFVADAVDTTFNLLLVDITTPINAFDTWLTGASMSIFMIILRWLNISLILFLIISPFIKLKRISIISGYIGVIIGLLNVIFFKTHILLFLGEIDFWHYRSIAYVFEVVLILSLSIFYLIGNLKSQKLLAFKTYLESLGIFALGSLAVIPITFFYNLFGLYGEIPEDYNPTHILLLIIPIIFTIISYFALRHKEQDQKDFFITLVAFAAFIQYFSYPKIGLSALPLHLCNMAVIIMLFSIVFRLKGFFYFNYFANVVGGIAALVFPDIVEDLFVNGAMRYAFNHWYVIAWPILAVALHTFARPKLKDMYKAIGVFTVYYLIIVFVNAWFNNYVSVDYFFVYGNHISEMFGLTGLQYGYAVDINYHGLTFTFFWLYQILFYFSFVFIMFVSWYVYDAGYNFADNQKLLHQKQKQIKLDQIRLKELLDGRKPSEPINLGGVDMIKISHFSKQYGHAKNYAVRDFSLEVNKGEVFGFLGHNGAGKSTTIKSLVGIQSITEGEMEICGYSIKTQPLEAKLQIGYVSDNHAVYEKLTGREYVQYIADLYKVTPELRDERLEKLLDQFSLRYAIDQEIKSYSHGMKQKLVVIAALIHEPPVWILDEPLTGLDPTSAYQIKKSMRDHADRGNIVFFSSHVIEVVEHICDRIAIITNGELQGVYDMKDIRKNNISLEELYMSKISKERV